MYMPVSVYYVLAKGRNGLFSLRILILALCVNDAGCNLVKYLILFFVLVYLCTIFLNLLYMYLCVGFLSVL
jgi:hypothetical protein